MHEKSSEKNSPERWTFPREMEGIYTDEQLKFFIGEAETRLRDSVTSLRTIRSRYYALINILLVIIGALCTVLITASLDTVHYVVLTVLLIHFCVVSAFAFFHLDSYIVYGPGYKPREAVGKGAKDWMVHYHGNTSETSCLYTILEFKQEAIDLNEREVDSQLKCIRKISMAIFWAMSASVTFLSISIIISLV